MSSILFPDDRVSNRTLNESPVEAIDAAINVVGEKKWARPVWEEDIYKGAVVKNGNENKRVVDFDSCTLRNWRGNEPDEVRQRKPRWYDYSKCHKKRGKLYFIGERERIEWTHESDRIWLCTVTLPTGT